MAEIVADKPFLPRQRTLVVIHGNIGAGKSTTLRFLSSKYERYVATGEVVIIPEPVEDWIDAGLLQASGYDGSRRATDVDDDERIRRRSYAPTST